MGLGGLWADHALGVLGAYPFLRVLPLAVSLLQRVPLANAPKEPKVWAPAFGPLAGARGSFAPELIRGHRFRFASLHLLSMYSTSSNGASRPPPDQSLHSACRRGRYGKIKSCSRANAHPVEWLRAMRCESYGVLFLLLFFCGSEPTREGGLTADRSLPECARPKLWELACQRWHPDRLPVFYLNAPSPNCGSEPAREGGLTADRSRPNPLTIPARSSLSSPKSIPKHYSLTPVKRWPQPISWSRNWRSP